MHGVGLLQRVLPGRPLSLNVVVSFFYFFYICFLPKNFCPPFHSQCCRFIFYFFIFYWPKNFHLPPSQCCGFMWEWLSWMGAGWRLLIWSACPLCWAARSFHHLHRDCHHVSRSKQNFGKAHTLISCLIFCTLLSLHENCPQVNCWSQRISWKLGAISHWDVTNQTRCHRALIDLEIQWHSASETSSQDTSASSQYGERFQRPHSIQQLQESPIPSTTTTTTPLSQKLRMAISRKWKKLSEIRWWHNNWIFGAVSN